jgi:hypothetical protein
MTRADGAQKRKRPIQPGSGTVRLKSTGRRNAPKCAGYFMLRCNKNCQKLRHSVPERLALPLYILDSDRLLCSGMQ